MLPNNKLHLPRAAGSGVEDDASLYEQALREADEGSAKPALWAKAVADADGDHRAGRQLDSKRAES